MNRQVLFAQGAGPGTHDDWDEKLADSLRSALGASWTVLYPRLPQEADPDPAAWQVALRREFGKLRDGDVLVGHSFGGTMLLHAVAATPPPFRPSALVLLAAPFYGPGGWKSAALEVPPHLASRLPAEMPLRLYHGTRDETVPLAHLDLYAKAIPEASTTAIPEGDHQFHDDLMQVARDISSLLDPPRRQS
jgi:hypothetical protein